MRGILAQVACLGLVSFGCAGDDVIEPPDDDGDEMTPGDDTPPDDQTPQPPVQRVELSMTEFRFDPSTIEALPGQPLLIVTRNVGSDLHSFAVELPERTLVLEPFVQPGVTDEIMFNAPAEPGAFTFFCPVAGHRQLGMVGTLTVR